MDRPTGDLDRIAGEDRYSDGPAASQPESSAYLLERSLKRLGVPERLFSLGQLDVLYDTERAALWTFMNAPGRPSFTPAMLADFESWQSLIAANFGPAKVPLRFLVLGSRWPGVFCYGGDLKLFSQFIRDRNRDGLVAYGYRCVEILCRNINTLELPMLTVGLVQGQALGGGFEAVLSFDFIIAERGSTFGLPEVSFGLFPGMGAHPILSRKLGAAMADRMILGNETYSAEQMYDLGIVHRLAEPGEGVAAVRDFIAKSDRRHAGMVNARRAARISSPLELSEFYRIVDLWADAALQLREHDLRLMERLAGAQERLAKAS